MKKLFAIFCLTLACAVCLCACAEKEEEREEISSTVYSINGEFENGRLNCTQTTAANIECGEAVFLLEANAYSENAVHKAYSTKLSRYGGLEIFEVNVDGIKTEPVFDEEGYYMTVPCPPSESKTREIALKYEVTLPNCSLRLGESDGYFNFGGFYPKLALFEDGEYRKDVFCRVGDPVVSDIADYSVVLTVPENFVVACPGEVEERCADGKKIVTAREKRMRDFTFSMSEEYVLNCAERGGVTVKYYSASGDYAETAANVIALFSEKYGEYPYGNYVVAETAFDGGMEYSGMCFVSKDSADKEDTVIHETVHQWFYNIVGSDNVNAPYLDEGLTTFMTEYYRLLDGEEERFLTGMQKIEKAYFTYEKLQKMRGDKAVLAVDGSIYEYNDYSYAMLVYYKTSLLFKNLYETAGRAKFDKALSLYVRDNYFRRATSDSLADSFGKAMNCDMKGYFDGWSACVAVGGSIL